MALDISSTLGPYEIISQLGRGGMGEVYLARDTRLDRQVALKLLPEVLARDTERVLRFEREARLLASLNHPNIAAIHGFEESNEKKFLVLEYVEGETLAVRLKRGALPIEEALEICKQVAEAVEAAHAKGVIHRDLKPGNVMITPTGTVKVLDFGLARAMASDSSASSVSPDSPTVTTQSPTITDNFTQPGVVLGTAAYMSPEQARGRTIDKRTDIWSFGVILFECLTGESLFQGETATDSIGAILHKAPGWTLLPDATPPTIQILLRRCLTKDRNKRLHDIADARVEIQETITDPSSSMLNLANAAVVSADTRVRWRRRGVVIGAFVLGASLAVVATLAIVQVLMMPTPRVQRFSIVLPHRQSQQPLFLPAIAVSPDGQTLAYMARGEDGARQLFVRPIDQPAPVALTGTPNAWNPVFSPDGQWIVFYSDSALHKISVRGGPTVELCESSWSTGVSWGSDGFIYFTRWSNGSLFRVSENGGEPHVLMEMEGDTTPRWPHALPGGRGVLFTSQGSMTGTAERNIEVYSFETGKTTRLVENGTFPIYAASGHLLFIRESTLMAVPFDAETLKLTGQPIPLTEEIHQSGLGCVSVALTRDGALYYVTGAPETELELCSVDRDGERTPLTSWTARFDNPSISPDGRRIVVEVQDPDNAQDVSIWLLDIERDTPALLTSEPGEEYGPIFSPDGRWVYYCAQRESGDAFQGLFRRRADGGGEPQLVYAGPRPFSVTSITPDGTRMLIREFPSEEHSPGTRSDISLLHLDGEVTHEPWLHGSSGEWGAKLSPNGRWVAYGSDVSGEPQVYVRPFATGGARFSVSRKRSWGPFWSPDGRTLYFMSNESGAGREQLMAVPVTSGADEDDDQAAFACGVPQAQFDIPAGPGGDLCVFPDGEHFLLTAPLSEESDDLAEIRVVLGFFEELKRLAPPGGND